MAKKTHRIPAILSREEVSRVINEIKGVDALVVKLLYGSGLRATEALSLRVKDIDFAHGCLTIRMAKGRKDRVVTLAQSLEQQLTSQIEKALKLHHTEVANGLGFAPVPYALRKKLGTALKSPGWQFVFPSANLCSIPDTGEVVRFHRPP